VLRRFADAGVDLGNYVAGATTVSETTGAPNVPEPGDGDP